MLKFLYNIFRRKKKPSKYKLVLKYFAYCFATIVVLALCLSALTCYWLSDRLPKSIDWIKYSVDSGGQIITFDNSTLTYVGNGNLKANASVKVRSDRGNVEVAHASDVNLFINFKPLLSLKPASIGIDISGMNINLDNLHIIGGSESNSPTFEFLDKVIGAFHKSGFLYIEKLDITNSSIIKNKMVFSFNQNLVNDSNETSTITTKIAHGREQPSKIELKTTKNSLNLKGQNVPVSLLASLAPIEYRVPYLYNANTNLKCDLGLDYNSKGAISLKLEVIELGGKKPLKRFIVEMHNKDINTLSLDTLSLNLDDGGIVNVSGAVGLNEFLVDLNIDTKKFNAQNLSKIWPLGVEIDLRNWLVVSLLSGKIDEGYLKIHLNEKPGQDSVTGYAKYQDISLQYSEEYEKITKLNGIAEINLNSVVFKVDSARILSSKIDDAKVEILYGEPDVPIKIFASTTHGKVKDFIHFIGKETLDKLNSKHVKIQEASGDVSAKASISFHIMKTIDLRNFEMNIMGHLQDLQIQMLDFINAKEGDLDLNITNKSVSLVGKAKINDQPSRIEWDTNLEDLDQIANRFVINSRVGPGAEFKKLLADKINIEEGEAFANFVYTDHLDSSAILVQLDFKDAKFTIPDIGVVKNKGEISSLHVEMFQDKIDGNWKSKKINLSSALININADIELEPSLNHVQLNSKVFYDNTELYVSFNSSSEKLDVKIHGPKLNLAKVNLLNLFNIGGYQNLYRSAHDGKQLEESKQKISMSMQIDDLYMKNNVKFTNLIGNFECHKRLCKDSGLSFNINDSDKVRVKLDSSNNQNLWDITASNASLFLKAFDIYTEIEDGVFEAQVQTVPKKLISTSSGSVISGKMRIKDFYAVKTNLIESLLFSSPLTAFSSLFRHKQYLYFENLEAHFIFSFLDRNLRINRSSARGNIFNITSQGYIKIGKNEIFLKGVLSPNSAANALLNSTIAVSYLVSGRPSKPAIEVNPLSSTIVGVLSKFLI